MGSVLSTADDRVEGRAWDARWSRLEEGAVPRAQLSLSDLVLSTGHQAHRSPAAESTGHAEHHEKARIWDARLSQLERDLKLEMRREAMAKIVQRRLQQLKGAEAQGAIKEKVPKTTKAGERDADGLVGEIAMKVVARAAGA
jgi:hypothetical protein